MNFISRYKRAFSILLSIIVIALILYKLVNDDSIIQKIQETWSLILTGSPIWIGVVLVLSPMNWMTEAYKWKFLLSKIQKISYLKALGSVLSGMSFAMVSPGKAGDFAGRLLYLDKGVRWRAFFMSIVGSFSHFLVTCLMGAIGLIYLCLSFGGWLFTSLFVGAILLCSLGLYTFLRLNSLKALNRKGKPKWMRKVLVSINVMKRYDRKDLIIVLAITLVKFIIYNTQFVIVASMLGADLGFVSTFLASCVMFWLIMLIPSFFMADVIIRGIIATMIFENTGLVSDTTPFISASYIIWLINWVLPSSLGGFVFLTKNLFRSPAL